jgi:hypothetical protein
MSGAPSFDAVERSVLSFLVDRLNDGKSYISPNDFKGFLATVGAETRTLAVGKYFEALGALKVYQHPLRAFSRTRERPFGERDRPTPEGMKVGWMITGEAIRLHKSTLPPREGETESGDQDGAKQGAGGKGRRRRGRRPDPDIDPRKDKRLCADWKAAKGQGENRETFCRERGITVQDLIDAQTRERYRRIRDAQYTIAVPEPPRCC